MAAKKKSAKALVKKRVAEKTPRERLEAIGIGAICSYISEGNSLRAWTRENGFAIVTVHSWIDADADRAEQYTRAREARADTIFENIDDVSEQAVLAETAVQVAGLRLKADNMKWMLGKMSPKKYGDRIQNEHSGPDGGNIPLSLAVSFVKSGK